MNVRFVPDVVQEADRMLGIRETQLRQAMALANIGAWEWDVIADSVTWSPELRRIIGVGPEVPPSPHTFISMIHPDDRAWAEHSMAESLRTGVAEERPFRFIRPDGHVRVLRGPAITTRHENGRPVYMVGVLQDIGSGDEFEELSRSHALIAEMSLRERQVLILVVQGSTSKGIAAVLGLSPKTVETYRSRIMAKLHVDDLAGLIRLAIRHGLTKF